MLTTVTSHVLMTCHGINVRPLSRLLSNLVRLTGFLVTEMPAEVKGNSTGNGNEVVDSLMLSSFIRNLVWLYTKPCNPCASAKAPHLQVRAIQTLQPRRRATATRTTSSANLSPQEERPGEPKAIIIIIICPHVYKSQGYEKKLKTNTAVARGPDLRRLTAVCRWARFRHPSRQPMSHRF